MMESQKSVLAVLPLAVPTKMYMTGSIRSWIHYIDLRSAHGTQKEHMDIANSTKSIFVEQFLPFTWLLEWKLNTTHDEVN